MVYYSGQMQDADGTWVPVALKSMDYVDEATRDEANRESLCMRAVKSAPNTATILTASRHIVDGKQMKVIAMK